jgi:outer membrane receptor for monomeric catechols
LIHVIPQKLIQDQGAFDLDDVVQDVSGVTQSSMDNNGMGSIITTSSVDSP